MSSLKNVIEYNAAPAADKFREIDAVELAEIIREMRVNESSARQTEWPYDAWQTVIAAATRAAELQDAFGERIFVARDEDGYYFAHEAQAMPKPPSPGAALAALRKTHGGGRPFRPQPCPRCGTPCASAVLARAHCRVPRVKRENSEK